MHLQNDRMREKNFRNDLHDRKKQRDTILNSMNLCQKMNEKSWANEVNNEYWAISIENDIQNGISAVFYCAISHVNKLPSWLKRHYLHM